MNKQKIFTLLALPFFLLTFPFSLYANELVPDIIPPVITLSGDQSVKINQNDVYLDAGATALDDIDGDITSNIVVTNQIDTSTLGDYTIRYNVRDQALNNAVEVTREVRVVAPVAKEHILIRILDSVIWEGDIDLPDAGTTSIVDIGGVSHDVDSRSVLAILYNLDKSSDAFSISTLEYYSSFNAFYLKCITAMGLLPSCDNWQYVVNNVTPFTGMDTTILSGGEKIGLYFGNPHQVILDRTSMNTEESFTAKAEKYNYEDNSWAPLLGVTIGVTLPDPNDPWNPIVVKEQAVDGDGKASISLSDVNVYTVGIKEDYYFPSYPLNVTASSGGGGGSQVLNLDVGKAVSFLLSKQSYDGSFGASLYTDWVSIAAVASQNSQLKSSLVSYLSSNPLNSSLLTDNERRSMALMALGIDPYSGTSVNYIAKIISAFDGTQFGDASLTNDDIFGLIVLKNAGYTSSDEIIKKTVAYVISQQSSSGSWGSVDMTSAGIQALKNFQDLPNASSSISKAESYLISSQGSDGGFGNSFSTSWALQAISGNPSFSLQVKNADAYLAKLQQIDGGLDQVTYSTEDRVWATSYAILGALHMPWNSIMQSFSKQNTPIVAGANTEPVKPKVEEVKQVDKKEEVKIPEKEVKTFAKPKKIKNLKKVVNPEVASQKNVKTPLSASAALSSSGQSLPYRVIHSIRDAILSPFVWLFVRLGF